MNALSSYRQLLRNRALTRLLFGEFVSGIGNWMYLVALMVIVYRASGDPVLLGIVGAARVLPYVFLSIPAGIVADRFDRRYVLITSDVVRLFCMLALAWLVATDGPVWAIIAVAILATCFATLFYPAIGALIPSLVSDESELGPANSAWSTLDSLAFVIGPGVAGLLIAAGGLTFAFLTNAVTFAIVAVVVRSLPSARPARAAAPVDPRPDAEEAADPAASAEPAAGINLRAATGVLVIDLASAYVFNGLFILLVILAVDVYRSGEAAVGYLNAAIGVGGVIGAIGSGVLVLRRGLRLPLLIGAVGMGVSIGALGLVGSLIPALVIVTVVAAAGLVLEVADTTIFQRVVSDAVRGRATGVIMTTSTLAGALGSLTLPALVEPLGMSTLLIIAGGGLIGLTVLGVGLIGTAGDRRPTELETYLEQARRLPVFGGLPPARLGVALDKLKPVPVAAGDVVIRQGDVADRFYIVGQGTFAVTASEDPAPTAARLLRRLGPNDIFGEIGLLTGARRTATVTAETDGLLLALDGPVFVDLVASGPGQASRFLAVYQGQGSNPDASTAEAG